MTVQALVLAILHTISVDDILNDARDLLTDGATEAEETAFVAVLLDAAVPEELLGARADEEMAPVYTAAAAKVTEFIRRKLQPKVRLAPGKLHPRVAAILQSGGIDPDTMRPYRMTVASVPV